MHVAAVKLHWVRVPFHEPFRISSGEVAVKDAILVEVDSPERAGWGEASPMAGSFYSSETPESTWEFLRNRLVPGFLVKAELDPRCCSEQLAKFPGEPFAKAGLEGAVWDLWANQRAKPLWEALGSNLRPLSSGAAIGLLPTIPELLDRVERFLKQGYRRIKIKMEPGRDVSLVRAVREKFGGIPLMVDANAAYQSEDWPVLKELDDFNLMMIEQPLGRGALEEHAELGRRLRTPICLDESADSLEAVHAIIRKRSARILNIKVQRMGGLWPARQAHDAAQAAGIPCWLGTMPELGIATAQGLHLATLPNFTFPSDVEASARWYASDIIAPPIEVAEDGLIRLPDGPGMGYCVDREEVERRRVRFEEFRA